MAVPVFSPSILHNPTSAQYDELWNIKSSGSPTPLVSALISSIRPLEAAIASRCLQELVCGGNTESVLRSMTSFQKAAATVSCQSCSQSLSKLILKQCAAQQQTVLFSLCSLDWNVQKQRLFPTPTSAGGRGGGGLGRGSVLYDLLLSCVTCPIGHSQQIMFERLRLRQCAGPSPVTAFFPRKKRINPYILT